jgi:hypothetical protein
MIEKKNWDQVILPTELSHLVNILPDIESAKKHIRGWYGHEPGYKDREGDFLDGVKWTLQQIERLSKDNS